MTNNIVFVSYYTKNTPYDGVMHKYLLPSLEKFNLKYEISIIENKGSWKANTDYKPKFILDKLQSYDTICWLDSDAVINKYPELLFTIEESLALHTLDWGLQYNKPGTTELLTGTLLINNSCIELVKQWITNCEHFNWEQQALQDIIFKNNIKYYNLPAEYCTVIKKDGSIPEYVKDPVIVHYQKSREYKRGIR